MKRPTVNFMLLWDDGCSRRWEWDPTESHFFFFLSHVSICLLLQDASSSSAEEEEERDRVSQRSSKECLCKRPAAACEAAACSFG